MPSRLAKLERSLGYTFKDVRLLDKALTHRSWAYENLTSQSEEDFRDIENESFEFVGDSVLGLVIAEALYLKHPRSSEGDLTLMKHHLVSTTTLARIGETLGVGEFMRVGRGEEKTGGRKKQALLANTVEAIIAAVFFDSGYIGARAFVTRIFADSLKNATPRTSVDYKTLLQETLQAQKMPAPQYKVTRTEGMPHARTFYVEAVWKNGKSSGSGRSIKMAEMMAASEALKALHENDGHLLQRNELE